MITWKPSPPRWTTTRKEYRLLKQAPAEAGAEAWRAGDLERYGELVFASGASSVYNYECGCDELKALYEKCVASDFDVKSGRLRDRDALDALVIEIGLAGMKK